VGYSVAPWRSLLLDRRPTSKAIADVSGRLENMMVAPGYAAVFLTGIATAVVGGLPLLGPFNGGPLWIFVPLVLFVAAVIAGPLVLRQDRQWGQALAEAARAGSITGPAELP
jgi:hypothetical protein